jgi:Transposase DDE domain group 1
LVGLLRQSVFGRVASYEDVNDAERLCRDPAMRWVVGGGAPMGRAASASQMGHFETEWLTRPANLAAFADLPGHWIDKVHQRRPPRIVVLDMDSSESPTYGDQVERLYFRGAAAFANPEIYVHRSRGHRLHNPAAG